MFTYTRAHLEHIFHWFFDGKAVMSFAPCVTDLQSVVKVGPMLAPWKVGRVAQASRTETRQYVTFSNLSVRYLILLIGLIWCSFSGTVCCSANLIGNICNLYQRLGLGAGANIPHAPVCVDELDRRGWPAVTHWPASRQPVCASSTAAETVRPQDRCR